MENLAECIDVEGNDFFTSAMQKFAPHQHVQTDDEMNHPRSADLHSARLRKHQNSEGDEVIEEKSLKSKKITLPSQAPNLNQTTTTKNSQKITQDDNLMNKLINQFEQLLEDFKNLESPDNNNSSTNENNNNGNNNNGNTSIQSQKSNQKADKFRTNQSNTLPTYSACVFESRGFGSKLFEVDQDELKEQTPMGSSLSNYPTKVEDINKENFKRLER